MLELLACLGVYALGYAICIAVGAWIQRGNRL